MLIKESRRGRPRVIDWWIAFCFLNVLLLLASIPFIDDLIALDAEFDASDPEQAEVLRVTHWVMGVLVGLYALVMGIGPLLPRGRTTWIIGIVQLVLSMLCGGCLCALPAVPIMVFWVRAPCRDWFENRDELEVAEIFQ